MRGCSLAVACAGLISLSACDSLFGLDRTYDLDARVDLTTNVQADSPNAAYVTQSWVYEQGDPASFPLAFFAAATGPQPMMFAELLP